MAAVSILVPTYNRSGYLKECLDSLLATTVPCEIIVADNASTDDTAAVMATYDDPRLRSVRHATNLGPCGNYNFLLQAATHEYLCLFGDDDIALPGCFEAKLAILDRNPEVAGAYSNLYVLDRDGNLSPFAGKVNGVPDCSFVSGRDEHARLLINCCISWQTLVFRRELYEGYGDILLQDEHLLATDWDFLISVTKGRRFAYINEPTVGIRTHADSASAKHEKESGRMVKDLFHLWRKWLVDSADLPVVTEDAWQSMARVAVAAAQWCYDADDFWRQDTLREMAVLQQDYRDRMNRDYHRSLQQWLPGGEDLDMAGLPLFRPGLRPAPDPAKPLRFFHHPTWESDTWKAVLTGYVTAFTDADAVELVFWLDPEQGVTAEAAGARIAAVLTACDLDLSRMADVDLVTDGLDLAGLARLYAGMDVVVPAGDPVQVRRGTRSGLAVMTGLAPSVWRRLAKRLQTRVRASAV